MQHKKTRPRNRVHGYPCPACGGPTRVLETRRPDGKGSLRGGPHPWRKRACVDCRKEFLTLEQEVKS